MGRTLTLMAVLLTFLGFVAAQAGDAQRVLADAEPPMVLQLVVDGKAHAIRLGEPLEVPTPAPKTTVVLRCSRRRLLTL